MLRRNQFLLPSSLLSYFSKRESRGESEDTDITVGVPDHSGTMLRLLCSQEEVLGTSYYIVTVPDDIDNVWGNEIDEVLSCYSLAEEEGDPLVYGDVTGDYSASHPSVVDFEPEDIHHASISYRFAEGDADEGLTPDWLPKAFTTMSEDEVVATFGDEPDFDVGFKMLKECRKRVREEVDELHILVFINREPYVMVANNHYSPIFEAMGNVRPESGDDVGGFLTVDVIFLTIEEFTVLLRQERLNAISAMEAAWKTHGGKPPDRHPGIDALGRTLCLRRFCRVRGLDSEDMPTEVVEPFARDIVRFL